jgi:hypothetical protein
MTTRCLSTASLLAVLIVSNATASPITIDFEALPAGNCAFLGPTVDTQGFTFLSGPTTLGFWSCDQDDAAIRIGDNTSRALINANFISNPTMANSLGEPFSLLSFDAGSRKFPVDYRSESILVTGLQADGDSVFARFLFDGTSFDTFVLPPGFENLVSVSWLAETSENQEHVAFLFDNIVVDAVPEPSSLVLSTMGFAALLRFRRRTKA